MRLLVSGFLALIFASTVQSQSLQIQSQLQGATWAEAAFDPAPEDGDVLAFVFTAMDWEMRLMPLADGEAVQAFEVPGDQGAYHVEWRDSFGALKRGTELEVTPHAISVFGPAEAKSGDTIEVLWTGPAFEGDRLFLYREEDDAYVVEVPLEEGQPAIMTLDAPAGLYELLYWLDAYKSIMVRQFITLN